MAILPCKSFAQYSYSVANKADTVYDFPWHHPFLIVEKDSSGTKCLRYDSKKILSKDISFVKGKDHLESYLRESFYKEVSSECLAAYVPFVIMFDKKLRVEDIILLYSPPFLNSRTLLRFLKKAVKRTQGQWTVTHERSDGYFYYCKLILL